MDPETGRVYHPASDKVGGVGLVADKLSILWTKVCKCSSSSGIIYISTSYIVLIESSMVMQEGRFEFGNGEDRPPTSFRWKGDVIQLENKIVPDRHQN